MISARIPAPATTGQTVPFRNQTTVVPTPPGPPEVKAGAPEPGWVGQGNEPVLMPAAYPTPVQVVPEGHGVVYIPAPAQTSDPAPEGHGVVIVPGGNGA